jgi:hypothetical protein
MPTFSELPAASALTGSEAVPILQDGITKYTTAGALGGGGVVPSSDNFVFTQSVPSSSWTVTHNLGRYPSVNVVDSSGRLVEGDVTYLSANSLVIDFSAGLSGAAYCN